MKQGTMTQFREYLGLIGRCAATKLQQVKAIKYMPIHDSNAPLIVSSSKLASHS